MYDLYLVLKIFLSIILPVLFIRLRDKMSELYERRRILNRVEFDESGENGLIVGDRYIPEELLAEMFCYVDYKSLLNCQLVCKRWKILMENYVWRKKAEMTIRRLLPPDKNMPWCVYYSICKKNPFERNLIKNHSGEEGLEKNWEILDNGGDRWKVENPPVGVPPLPINQSVFEDRQFCFVTSYGDCSKEQIIDLEVEGISPYILDNLQPPIAVSEWYSCRWDCPAVYKFAVKLLGKGGKVLDYFEFRDNMEGEKQNEWHCITTEFKKYGCGLRKISFYHSGISKLFWAGHYGSKMAGACVRVKIPALRNLNDQDVNISAN